MALAVIVLAACQPAVEAEPPSASIGVASIAAPDFELQLYQGADIPGAEPSMFSELFNQGKPVVLNFWAGLCPPCRAEMPGFQAVYDEMNDQFILVGLDIGPFVALGTYEEGQRLLRELAITYPVGTTPVGSVLADYRVRGMPTTVFLTAAGDVVKTHAGLLDEKTFRSEVRNLIDAESKTSLAPIPEG